MAIGLVGRKSGMTRIFTEEGVSVPVTVIEVSPNRITRVKTADSDGYAAVQVTTGEVKQNRVNKPDAGQFAKSHVPAGRGLWEFRVEELPDDLEVGGEMTMDQFEPGQKVDVRGISKGKGYAGTIKRWNFRGQDNSHGNSVSHRAPGSIGQCQTPGRVFKGKKMAGQLGNARVTTQNLEIVRIDSERNLLLVKGAVPGPAGGDVCIRPAVKARGAAAATADAES
jgi:large subunit ribosomal protein L3